MSSSSSNVFVATANRSFVSQSGLVAVLKAVKEHGVPDAISRRTVKRRRIDALPSQTPVGPLWTTIKLNCEENETMDVPVVNPYPLLYLMLERNDAFRQFFEEASAGQSVDNPLRVILYCDEILPGDQLKVTNMRKMVGWYWSVANFQSRLGCEQLWFHCCILRSAHVKKVLGQYSQIFKAVVNLFLTPPYDGRLGVPLPLSNLTFVFFKIGLFLADEAALKQCWSNKGSSGMFICLFCQNVTNVLLDLASHDQSKTLVPSCVCNLKQCRLHTDESLTKAAKLLVDSKGTMGVGAFDDLEKALGLTWVPEGALLDPAFVSAVPPISVSSFDWMHIYLVNGLWNSETGALIQLLKGGGVTVKTIHDWLKQAQFPSGLKDKGISGLKCLLKHKEGSLSCSASEGLSLYAPLRAFLRGHIGSAPDACNSYFALAEVLDLLIRTRKGTVLAAEAWLKVISPFCVRTFFCAIFMTAFV